MCITSCAAEKPAPTHGSSGQRPIVNKPLKRNTLVESLRQDPLDRFGSNWQTQVNDKTFEAFRVLSDDKFFSLNEFGLSLLIASKGTVGEKACCIFNIYGCPCVTVSRAVLVLLTRFSNDWVVVHLVGKGPIVLRIVSLHGQVFTGPVSFFTLRCSPSVSRLREWSETRRWFRCFLCGSAACAGADGLLMERKSSPRNGCHSCGERCGRT